MDVLTDTEVPERCADAPQRSKDIWHVQKPLSPHDIWGTYTMGNRQMVQGEGHMDVWGCTDVLGAYRYPLC